MTPPDKASPPPKFPPRCWATRYKNQFDLPQFMHAYGSMNAALKNASRDAEIIPMMPISEHEEAVSRATAEAKISILRNLLDNDMIVTWAQESGRERCFDLEKALAARSVEQAGEAKKEGIDGT